MEGIAGCDGGAADVICLKIFTFQKNLSNIILVV